MKFGAADHLPACAMQRLMQCGVSASLANETRRAASSRRSETRNLKFCAVCLGAKLGRVLRASRGFPRKDAFAVRDLLSNSARQICVSQILLHSFGRFNLSRALEFAERDL